MMIYRALPVFAVALALVLGASLRAVADDVKEGTHDGLVVMAGDGKLTMTDKDGSNKHTHTVPADAKITCDGKECKLEELEKGCTVKVTIDTKGDQKVVTKIEAKKKEKDK